MKLQQKQNFSVYHFACNLQVSVPTDTQTTLQSPMKDHLFSKDKLSASNRTMKKGTASSRLLQCSTLTKSILVSDAMFYVKQDPNVVNSHNTPTLYSRAAEKAIFPKKQQQQQKQQKNSHRVSNAYARYNAPWLMGVILPQVWDFLLSKIKIRCDQTGLRLR